MTGEQCSLTFISTFGRSLTGTDGSVHLLLRLIHSIPLFRCQVSQPTRNTSKPPAIRVSPLDLDMDTTSAANRWRKPLTLAQTVGYLNDRGATQRPNDSSVPRSPPPTGRPAPFPGSSQGRQGEASTYYNGHPASQHSQASPTGPYQYNTFFASPQPYPAPPGGHHQPQQSPPPDPNYAAGPSNYYDTSQQQYQGPSQYAQYPSAPPYGQQGHSSPDMSANSQQPFHGSPLPMSQQLPQQHSGGSDRSFDTLPEIPQRSYPASGGYTAQSSYDSYDNDTMTCGHSSWYFNV